MSVYCNINFTICLKIFSIKDQIKKAFAYPTDIRLLGKNRSQYISANLLPTKILSFSFSLEKNARHFPCHHLPISLIPGSSFFIHITSDREKKIEMGKRQKLLLPLRPSITVDDEELSLSPRSGCKHPIRLLQHP